MTIDAAAEILTTPERRRRRTSEQKLALVAETLRPEASPTQIARRYGISTVPALQVAEREQGVADREISPPLPTQRLL
jgi:transposase-like protein